MNIAFPARNHTSNMPPGQPSTPLPVNTATPPPPPGSSPVVSPPSPGRKIGKAFLIIPLVLLLLAAVGFSIYKFVLPRIGGGGEANLTWWGLWEDESVVRPLIEEYQQNNPNVKITYLQQAHHDYRERLTNALAKGEGPDIFRFHNSWVPMFKKELDYVPASVMSAGEFAQTYYPVVSADLTSGTGLVGIPLEYDGLALFINEELFEKSGKTPPNTWNDLRQLAKELTIEENGVIKQSGVALGRTENVDHWPEIVALMMLQSGVNLSKPLGEKAENAITYYTLFSSVDHVWDETLPPSTTAFANGKVAMYFAPSWRVFEIKTINPNLRFKAVPLPQLPKLDSGDPDVTYASYWVEGVWTRSRQKEEAWKFVKFISSKESLEKMYQNAAKTRLFGEPYPRTEMATTLEPDPYVGTIVKTAPDAQSWYLASRTQDGPTGINSQLNKYFEDAINGINKGESADKVLSTAASGISQVLSQYGLVVY